MNLLLVKKMTDWVQRFLIGFKDIVFADIQSDFAVFQFVEIKNVIDDFIQSVRFCDDIIEKFSFDV